MKIGDALEWFAGAAFVTAAAVGLSLAWAFVVAGVSLAYFGQCYGATAFPRVSRPRWLRRPAWSKRKPVVE
jgi:hypothetical protein